MTFERFTHLVEANKKTKNLVPDSEAKRKARAENVKVLKFEKVTPSKAPTSQPILPGWQLFEFEVVSEEKTENRNHQGYLVFDRNKNIKDVFCSCADFQFLWRYALTEGEMASWEVYPDYKDIETYAPHTKEPSDETNPGYDRKLCKHLIKVFSESGNVL